jgi:hypothetical protein
MFGLAVLACAALFSAPSLWSAFVEHSSDGHQALIRFAIAVPVAAILLAIVRAAARPAPATVQVDEEHE